MPALTFRARRDGELLIVTCIGLATMDGQRRLREFTRNEVARKDCRAMVIDMRPTVHAMCGLDEWRLAGRDPSPAAGPPAAIVVLPERLAWATAYCDEMAHRRLLRHAFSAMAPAVSWAYRRREHWLQPPRLPFFHSSPALSRTAPADTPQTSWQDL